jgi:hypothetical protein
MEQLDSLPEWSVDFAKTCDISGLQKTTHFANLTSPENMSTIISLSLENDRKIYDSNHSHNQLALEGCCTKRHWT